jgi:hypothetical protein
VSNNTTNDHVWGIHVGDDNGGATASGVNVYGNTVGPSFNVWTDAAQDFHADGIFFTCANPGASFKNSSIYNNYVHGDMSSTLVNGHIQNSTGYIYVDGACGGVSNINVFNNIVSHDVVGNSGAGPEGLMVLRWSSGNGTPGVNVYNNTLNVAQPPHTDCVKLGSGSAGEVKFNNNVASGCGEAFTIPGAASTIIASQNNVWYNMVNHFAAVGGGPTYYGSMSSWNSATGLEANSTTSNPNLSSTYTLQSGSSAIGLGANLDSMGIVPLDSDKAGAQRPGTPMAWDAGVYQSNVIPPPSNLKASVQ